MSSITDFQVHFDYDPDAKVWFVSKSDIPGLSLEAQSPAALIERVMNAVPELLELNEGLLVKSMEAHLVGPRRPATALPQRASRPRITPVFDTPLELACA